MSRLGYVSLPHTSTSDEGELQDESAATISKDLVHGGSLVITSENKYTYNYGPRGVGGLLSNYYVLLCAIFASIGGLSFGYDQGVIANVLVMTDFLERWPITPLQKGVMTAVLELGALCGAVFAGAFADRYTRRQSIVAACTVFCIGSAFQGGAQSLTHLFIGRAIGGVGVGALSMLSPLYLAEISPPEVRGSLMALEQFSIVLGVVFGFWTGFITREIPSSLSWRIPLYLQLIPGFILAFGSVFLPPSPRLLVLHERFDEALSALARLRLRSEYEAQDDPLIQIELLEMRVDAILVQRKFDVTGHKEGWARELTIWKKLFGYEYRDRTLVGVVVMVFQQWSGINALLYYGPTLVRTIGLRGDKVTLLVSGGIGIVQFVAVFPAILYLDRWGRRPLLRGGSAVMAVSHFIIAIMAILFADDWAGHPFAVWMAVGAVYIFTFFYGISLGPIGWVLPSEVFPLSMRSKGVALSTASNWINNFLIGLITPLIVDLTVSGTFIIFSTACFLCYLWATYSVPETANVSLEEIDKVFRSSAGKEDQILREQVEEDIGLRKLLRELIADER